jgi:hypothetical protein
MLTYLKLFNNRFSMIFFGVSCFTIFSCAPQNNNINRDFNQSFPEYLNIITQKEWGGSENLKIFKTHKIDRITLHHGGVEFPKEKDPIEYLQNLQSWSRTEKKWIDIPYHFLIDLNGKIYEGRLLEFPGDTNTSYDPTGHLLICLMGNYEIQIVDSAQIEALTDLLAFYCKELNISTDLIKGHKDYAETACPGKDFYKYLENGSLVQKVKEKLDLLN